MIDSLKTAIGEVPGLTATLEVVKELLDPLNVVVDEVEVG